jgi:hypothetical protein
LAVAILALAVGASQGLAGASGKGTQTARVQLHNDNCGIDNGKPFIGKAKFTLSSSGKLRISFQVSGADPGLYDIELWSVAPDGDCDFEATVSKLKVDSSGSGSKVGQVCCFSSGPYIATAENDDTGQFNDSQVVNL